MAHKKGLSRREFLRLSGMAGGALTFAHLPNIPRPAPSRSLKKQAKTINVLVVGDPFQFALDKVLDQFTEKTGIGVNLENLSYDALQARLITSFVSQTPDADVVTVDQMWVSQYADNGWIIPLDEYAKADSDTQIDDFIPQVLHSLNTWRGHLWTLPIGAYGQGVIFRTDLLEAAGLPTPPKTPAEAGDWTWARYMEYINTLNGMTMGDRTIYGTVVCGAQPIPIVHMYTQLAASYGTRWFKSFPEVNENGVWDFAPTINSDANKAALADYKKLYDASPPEAINYVWFDAGTRFSQADIGMFYWWTPYFYLVKNSGYMTGTPSEIIDKYDVGVLPTLEPGGQQVVSLGGWSLGIPRYSDNQDEAWQFVKWATGVEGQKAMALVPDYNYQFSDFGRLSLYQDPELQAIYPYLPAQLEIMRQGNGKIPRPPIPIYTSLEGVYGLQLNRVLSGEASPEEALATTEVLFNNILAGNQYVPNYLLESYDDTLENTIALMESLKA